MCVLETHSVYENAYLVAPYVMMASPLPPGNHMGLAYYVKFFGYPPSSVWEMKLRVILRTAALKAVRQYNLNNVSK